MFCLKCKNPISRNSVTNLCRHCNSKERRKRWLSKQKEKRYCINCGKKVNPIITYPNGLDGIKKIKYTSKCYYCRESEKQRSLSRKSISNDELKGGIK